MSTKIFVNLPVRDLERSKGFFQALGYSINPHFSDETAACLVISEQIYAMLLTHPKMKEFIPHEISDAHRATEVLIALSCDSREEVDRMADTAVNAGGCEFRERDDMGFMYLRRFQDLDGHIWETFRMDPAAVPPTGSP